MSPTERLGDHVEVLGGFAFKSDDYAEEGVRLLRGDNIAPSKLRWNGAKKWPTGKSGEYERYSLRVDDIVLAMDRPWIDAGLKVAAVREADLPCLLVQRVARLRALGDLDQGYVRYLLSTPEFAAYIRGVQTGTGVPHISARQIQEFRFTWIPRPVQQAIAEVLSALDDKIALNERICETSLALADCHAELASWGGGSRPNVTMAQLATQEMLEFGDGYRTKRAEHGTPGLPILRVAEVADGEIRPAFGDYVSEAFRSAMGRKTSKSGDVILTTKGTVGRVAMIADGYPEFVYSPQVCYFRVRSSAQLSGVYLFHWMRGPEFWRQAAGMKGQTDMADYLSLSDIKSLRITLPSEAALAEFNRKCAPLHARSEAARNENRTLADLRDTLLPQLVTGKIRVKDATRAVEEAV